MPWCLHIYSNDVFFVPSLLHEHTHTHTYTHSHTHTEPQTPEPHTPEPPDPCKNHTCNNYGTCTVVSNNQTRCVCGSIENCSSEDDQVCVNGVTYHNECHMKVQICLNCPDNSPSCKRNLFIQKGRCVSEGMYIHRIITFSH